MRAGLLQPGGAGQIRFRPIRWKVHDGPLLIGDEDDDIHAVKFRSSLDLRSDRFDGTTRVAGGAHG